MWSAGESTFIMHVRAETLMFINFVAVRGTIVVQTIWRDDRGPRPPDIG
jgi:hypothetical protein